MATERIIAQELGRLSTLYRHQLTPAELTVIVEAWIEDFADVSDALFIQASKAYRRAYSFFPAGTRAMLELCEGIRQENLERQRLKLRALPCDEGEYTVAERSRIADNCQRILDSLSRRMSVQGESPQ